MHLIGIPLYNEGWIIHYHYFQIIHLQFNCHQKSCLIKHFMREIGTFELRFAIESKDSQECCIYMFCEFNLLDSQILNFKKRTDINRIFCWSLQFRKQRLLDFLESIAIHNRRSKKPYCKRFSALHHKAVTARSCERIAEIFWLRILNQNSTLNFLISIYHTSATEFQHTYF